VIGGRFIGRSAMFSQAAQIAAGENRMRHAPFPSTGIPFAPAKF
jgi:hypothetical protein